MTDTVQRRGPYAGTAQRRQAILEVAWEVFATQGYRGGSLREIADRVGLSQAGVLHHFGSKEKLLLAVLEYREEINRQDVGREGGLAFLDDFRTIVVRNIETPGAVRLFVTMSAEATDPEHPAHDYFVRRYKQVLATLTGWFTMARLDGWLASDLDPAEAARQMVAHLDGIQLQWLLSPDMDMLRSFDDFIAGIRARYAVNT